MSAEALRQFTRDAVRKKVDEYGTDLTTMSSAPLDEIRLMQGVIRGLHEALDLMQDAHRRIGNS